MDEEYLKKIEQKLEQDFKEFARELCEYLQKITDILTKTF